jgi:hypothetical protein
MKTKTFKTSSETRVAFLRCTGNDTYVVRSCPKYTLETGRKEFEGNRADAVAFFNAL